MSRERPILFSGPLVRAISEGRKTIARRVVTVPWSKGKRTVPYEPYYVEEDGELLVMDEFGDYHRFVEWVPCPYGAAGDLLWVKETWQALHVYIDPETGHGDDFEAAAKIPKHNDQGRWSVCYRATDPLANEHRDDRGFSWRPSIFMPRWASRITLEVTGVRVERVQEISEEDARAEGVGSFCDRFPDMPEQRLTTGERAFDSPYRAGFAVLWDEINARRNGGAYSWAANPWCWVLTFRRVQPAGEGG